MDYQKILYWKNWSWKNLILFIIVSIIIILVLQSVIFLTTPTKAEVESFLKVDRLFNAYSCNPYATITDFYSEHSCAYYLRRHTTLIFGQIMNTKSPLFIYTPFGYFNYDPTPGEFGCALNDSCKKDEHSYVFVVTRDEGPLVYNPVNGDFIGSYNDLMQEMGCEVQPYEKPFFPIQLQKNKLEMELFRCSSNNISQQLDALKLNSTDK
jgi:hypothetical protein